MAQTLDLVGVPVSISHAPKFGFCEGIRTLVDHLFSRMDAPPITPSDDTAPTAAPLPIRTTQKISRIGSGQRGSNPRPLHPQRNALPTELRPDAILLWGGSQFSHPEQINLTNNVKDGAIPCPIRTYADITPTMKPTQNRASWTFLIPIWTYPDIIRTSRSPR